MAGRKEMRRVDRTAPGVKVVPRRSWHGSCLLMEPSTAAVHLSSERRGGGGPGLEEGLHAFVARSGLALGS